MKRGSGTSMATLMVVSTILAIAINTQLTTATQTITFIPKESFQLKNKENTVSRSDLERNLRGQRRQLNRRRSLLFERHIENAQAIVNPAKKQKSQKSPKTKKSPKITKLAQTAPPVTERLSNNDITSLFQDRVSRVGVPTPVSVGNDGNANQRTGHVEEQTQTLTLFHSTQSTPENGGYTSLAGELFKRDTEVSRKSALNSLANAQKSLKSAQKSIKSAKQSKKSAKKSITSALKEKKSAIQSINSALDSYNSAKTTSAKKSLKSALKEYKKAVKSYQSAKKSKKSALNALKSANEAKKSAINSLFSAKKSVKTAGEVMTASQLAKTLKSEQNSLKSQKQSLKSARESLKSVRESKKSLQQSKQSIRKSLKSAIQSLNSATKKASKQSAIDSLNSALKSYKSYKKSAIEVKKSYKSAIKSFKSVLKSIDNDYDVIKPPIIGPTPVTPRNPRPAKKPSVSPSAMPTTSSAPSTSAMPSTVPTISVMPSTMPSTSAMPSITGMPSTSTMPTANCVVDDSGVIGVGPNEDIPGASPIVLSFTFEMETNPTISTDTDGIVSAVAGAVASTVANNGLDGCSNTEEDDTTNNRKKKRRLFGRRLKLFGISTAPDDQILPSDCQAVLSDDRNDCVVVLNTMTIVTDDEESDTDEALSAIRLDMNSGKMDDAHPAIVGLQYVQGEGNPVNPNPSPFPRPAPLDPGDGRNDPIVSEATSESRVPIIIGSSVGAGVFLMIACVLCFFGRRTKIRPEEDYDSDKFSEMQYQHVLDGREEDIDDGIIDNPEMEQMYERRSTRSSRSDASSVRDDNEEMKSMLRRGGNQYESKSDGSGEMM